MRKNYGTKDFSESKIWSKISPVKFKAATGGVFVVSRVSSVIIAFGFHIINQFLIILRALYTLFIEYLHVFNHVFWLIKTQHANHILYFLKN